MSPIPRPQGTKTSPSLSRIVTFQEAKSKSSQYSHFRRKAYAQNLPHGTCKRNTPGCLSHDHTQYSPPEPAAHHRLPTSPSSPQTELAPAHHYTKIATHSRHAAPASMNPSANRARPQFTATAVSTLSIPPSSWKHWR